jgi:transposase
MLVLCGIVAAISVRTVQRWLKEDKLKPWRFRSWITPKDIGKFLERACPVLNLYEQVFLGRLGPKEIVYSIDEKTSIQARHHASYSPTGKGEPAHLEHTYARKGAVTLMAALNVLTGGVTGEIFADKLFESFALFLTALLEDTRQAGYTCVHLILDNGSTHRPKHLRAWLDTYFPDFDVVLHWLPVRSSWLNQIEIFFSLLQREALTPNNFEDIEALENRILGYVEHHNGKCQPIEWTYTSNDLRKKHEAAIPAPAADASLSLPSAA